MRFYFHLCKNEIATDDHEGMDLPSLAAALEEGQRIIDDLLGDPGTSSFRGGVVNIVASGPPVFISLPIVRRAEIATSDLN